MQRKVNLIRFIFEVRLPKIIKLLQYLSQSKNIILQLKSTNKKTLLPGLEFWSALSLYPTMNWYVEIHRIEMALRFLPWGPGMVLASFKSGLYCVRDPLTRPVIRRSLIYIEKILKNHRYLTEKKNWPI